MDGVFHQSGPISGALTWTPPAHERRTLMNGIGASSWPVGGSTRSGRRAGTGCRRAHARVRGRSERAVRGPSLVVQGGDQSCHRSPEAPQYLARTRARRREGALRAGRSVHRHVAFDAGIRRTEGDRDRAPDGLLLVHGSESGSIRGCGASPQRDVQEFSTSETATALDATEGQVKNWLQQARRTLEVRYAETCALVAKDGVCHQCVELDRFFNGTARNPLEGPRGISTRDSRSCVATARHRSAPGIVTCCGSSSTISQVASGHVSLTAPHRGCIAHGGYLDGKATG